MNWFRKFSGKLRIAAAVVATWEFPVTKVAVPILLNRNRQHSTPGGKPGVYPDLGQGGGAGKLVLKNAEQISLAVSLPPLHTGTLLSSGPS